MTVLIFPNDLFVIEKIIFLFVFHVTQSLAVGIIEGIYILGLFPTNLSLYTKYRKDISKSKCFQYVILVSM